MAALLGTLSVELVLTAHPTEAKRRTVLSKLQRIAETLRRLHDPDLLPRERDAETRALRAEVTALWLTDRMRTARPAVTDEVRTGLYFVDAVFWDALPRVAAELESALRTHYPDLASPPGWLTLASWIGGDRDGNPPSSRRSRRRPCACIAVSPSSGIAGACSRWPDASA